MPIICLEGASAVGKSSTSKAMQERFDACIIDEVNKLFVRSKEVAKTWYFERQGERTNIAQASLNDHEIVILDGDPFQPLWYNWCYNFIGWEPLNTLNDFYREMIIKRKICFPDCYYYLYCTEEELRKRRENDSNNKRNNFDKHLNFITPQRAYFEYMKQLEPTYVTFIEAETINNSIETIIKNLDKQQPREKSDLKIFDDLIEWLRSNKASDFASNAGSECHQLTSHSCCGSATPNLDLPEAFRGRRVSQITLQG